jgi:hypothetical protein
MIQTPGGWRCQVDLELRSITTDADGTHLTVSFDVRRGGLGPDQRSVETLVASTFTLTPGEVAVAGTSRLTQGTGTYLFLVSSSTAGKSGS